jgi:hypothetical protein
VADPYGLDLEDTLRAGLHLARLLQSLPTADDPLATLATAQARLGPLGPAGAFDGTRFTAWRRAHWPDGRRAEEAGAALAAGPDRRSNRPAVLALLLRHPALTAPALARAITPQAALRLLAPLAAAGVVAEVTGRKSFRAFGIFCG